MVFRNGQWVKFSPDSNHPAVDELHTADGKIVGLFVKGGVDATGEVHKDRINVVDKNGVNLEVVAVDKDGGKKLVTVSVDPAAVQGLEPVTNRDHIPAARLKHAPKDWNPKP